MGSLTSSLGGHPRDSSATGTLVLGSVDRSKKVDPRDPNHQGQQTSQTRQSSTQSSGPNPASAQQTSNSNNNPLSTQQHRRHQLTQPGAARPSLPPPRLSQARPVGRERIPNNDQPYFAEVASETITGIVRPFKAYAAASTMIHI